MINVMKESLERYELKWKNCHENNDAFYVVYTN